MTTNFEYTSLIPADFDDKAKVWIYQSNRLFTMSEALEIEDSYTEFVDNWQSHGKKVKGFAILLFGQFLVLMADENETTVGGCSTDGSIHFVQSINAKYGVDMLNRQNLAFVVKDKIQTIPLSQFAYAFENNFINSSTIYFNNLVLDKSSFLSKWMIPIEESWLKNKMKQSTI